MPVCLYFFIYSKEKQREKKDVFCQTCLKLLLGAWKEKEEEKKHTRHGDVIESEFMRRNIQHSISDTYLFGVPYIITSNVLLAIFFIALYNCDWI